MYYLCKILREFFRLFGERNSMYKQLQKAVENNPRKKLYRQIQTISTASAYFVAYMRFKQHFGIEIPAEAAYYGNNFEYVRIKVGDIKREWQRKLYPLKQCSPYKYLETKDTKIYENYIKKLANINICSPNTLLWNVKVFDALLESIKKDGYNPTKSVICVTENNVLIDGQHRACCLLYLYGEDYEINVIKVSR